MKFVVLLYIHTDEWADGEIEEIFLGEEHVRLVLDFGDFFVGYTDIPGVIVIGRRVPKWATSKRGLDVNPTTCFPGRPDGNRDERYAWFVTMMCRGADLVIDVHETRSRDVEVSIAGPYGWRDWLVNGVASLVSQTMCVYSAPHPAGVLPHYVGFDIPKGSRALGRLYGWVKDLAAGWRPTAQSLHAFQYVGDVPGEVAAGLGLKRRYPFHHCWPIWAGALLPAAAARALGHGEVVVPIHWDADLYHNWGEIFVPIIK